MTDKPIKIGIDVFSLVPGQGMGGGFHTYIKTIIKYLAIVDKKNFYYLFCNKLNINYFECSNNKNFKFVVCPLPPYRKVWFFRIIWQQLILPFFLLKYKIDIIHFPTDIGSFLSPCPIVVTFHDSITDVFYTKNFPSHIPKLKRLYSFYFKKITGKLCKRMIAISNFSKEEAIRNYNIDPEKIDVIYEGIEKELWQRENNESSEDASKKEFKYILSVVSTSPHKNIEGIVKTFNILKEKYKSNLKLILVGMPGMDHKYSLKIIESSPYKDEIILKGYVPFDELVKLYKNAELLLYISLVEGFGLPVLEAMAVGLPTVVSNCGAIPEVAGDASIILPPKDYEEIAYQINNLLHDKILRDSLIQKGKERVNQFSWLNSAMETVKVYENCYNKFRRK